MKPDNPEVIAARAKLLPVVRRAEMLAELMRLKWSVAVGGTHGKTTTTSMVAALIDAAGLDPTVINGGIINNYGTNARLGAGDWMVVEADESDGTFVKLPAVITIVTNMDPEHLDHYGSVEAMNRAYEDFVHNIPFYGFAVLCIDHPVVQAMIPRLSDRRIITYGFSPQADVRATDLRLDPAGSTYNVVDQRPLPRDRQPDRRRAPADGGPAQCAEQPRRHRRRLRDAHRRERDPEGLRRLRRGQAPLHPHRRGERRHGDRRLRPPPGGDRRGAEGGARRRPRAR